MPANRAVPRMISTLSALVIDWGAFVFNAAKDGYRFRTDYPMWRNNELGAAKYLYDL